MSDPLSQLSGLTQTTDATGGPLIQAFGPGGAAASRASGLNDASASGAGGVSLSSELEDELQAFEQSGSNDPTMAMQLLQELYQQLMQQEAAGDQEGAAATQQQISQLEQQLGASSPSDGGGYTPSYGGGSAPSYGGGGGGTGGGGSVSGGGGGVSGGADTGPVSTDQPAPTDPSGKVQAMVDKADSLLGKPYVFGGGHGGWGPSEGYDCSGFVSAVLHAGGYLSSPVDTTALPGQAGIEKGPGKNVTIYDRAQPGENGHVIIEINNQFYESGGSKGPWGGGGGVQKIGRPSQEYLKSFETVLHPKDL